MGLHSGPTEWFKGYDRVKPIMAVEHPLLYESKVQDQEILEAAD